MLLMKARLDFYLSLMENQPSQSRAEYEEIRIQMGDFLIVPAGWQWFMKYLVGRERNKNSDQSL